MVPLLEFEGISKRFPGGLALDRVDFDLYAGEVHALLGEDGAGKSTMVQLASGVLAPDSGRIVLGGKVSASGPKDPRSARRRGIVAVHQGADLFDAFSVAENMAMVRGLPTSLVGRVRWRRVRDDARAAVASLDEPFDVRRLAERLNVAQRHLVQLAAAVSVSVSANRRTRIVLLDEPTAALSSAEAGWLFAQVERLKAAGVGLLYVTRRHGEACRIADRITVLRDGRNVWTGAASSIDRDGLARLMAGRDPPRARASAAPRPPPKRHKTSRLRVRDLTDARGRFEAIDVDVHAGEVLGVYGLIGAGRSAWAQALFGLRRLRRGRIEIDGYPYVFTSPGDAVAAGVAYLPEDRPRQGTCPGLSVRANMVLADPAATTLGPLAIAPAEALVTREQVAALGVRPVDIKRPIGLLPAGDQQKVVLGRWLLTEPKVLLLDEPTQGMDVASRAEIHRLIRQRADRGSAVVVIGSALPELLAHADRIAVFRSGRIAGVFDARDASPEVVAEAAMPRADPDASGDADPTARRPVRRRLRSEFRGQEAALIVVIAAMAAALSATTGGRFGTAANLGAILGDASSLAVLALGVAAVIIAGGIDVSIGALAALAATIGGLVMSRSPRPELAVPLGLFAALATGAVAGLLNASMALLGRLRPIVVTLGALAAYRGLLVGRDGGHVVGLPPSFRRLANGRLDVPGLPIPVEGSIVVMLVVAFTVHSWLAHARSGRSLYAFGGNAAAAWRAGIGRRGAWLTAFGVGGLCAAIAGLLELARDGSPPSDMVDAGIIRAIAAAVIGGTALRGGRGGVPGVVLGALFLALVANALALREAPRHVHDLVNGGLLLAALLIDRGLWGAGR